MAQVSPFLRSVGGGGLSFWCAGCKCAHTVWVGHGDGPRWGWNNDVNAPVFSPSVLVQHDQWTPPVTRENLKQWQAQPWEQHKVRHVCHSFVGMNNAKPGQIEYLGDCTHELAGKTIDLPQLPPFMTSDS